MGAPTPWSIVAVAKSGSEGKQEDRGGPARTAQSGWGRDWEEGLRTMKQAEGFGGDGADVFNLGCVACGVHMGCPSRHVQWEAG